MPESIVVQSKLNEVERSRLACAVTRESVEEAESYKETLTLIDPAEVNFSWHKKSESELIDERRKHAELVRQISMFDKQVAPLEPCPYEFRFKWKAQLGTSHAHTCDDWETSTAFFRRREQKGEIGALNSLRETFECEYPSKGMRLALGTHSRRNAQWLLVGVLRVNNQVQQELAL